DDRRDLPSVSDMAASGDTLWIASPRAHGVACIDRAVGDSKVIRLPRPTDFLWLDGEGCVVREATEYAGDHVAPFPQLLWQVTRERLAEIDIGAAVDDLAVLDGTLVALVRRPHEAPVDHPRPEGWTDVFH